MQKVMLDISGIEVWNRYRSQTSIVNQYLNDHFNAFLFTCPKDVNEQLQFHFYLSVNGNILEILALTSEEDVLSGYPEITRISIHHLPFPNEAASQSSPLAYQTAQNWFQYWNNTSSRENWIQENIDKNGGIFQAFTIGVNNFEADCEHIVFFAFNGSSPDLIVYNIHTGQFTNVLRQGYHTKTGMLASYDDFAAPVPPFKPHTRTAKANFALLSRLDID